MTIRPAFLVALAMSILAQSASAKTFRIDCKNSNPSPGQGWENVIQVEEEAGKITYLDDTGKPAWSIGARISPDTIEWHWYAQAQADRTGNVEDRSSGKWGAPQILNGTVNRSNGNAMMDFVKFASPSRQFSLQNLAGNCTAASGF